MYPINLRFKTNFITFDLTHHLLTHSKSEAFYFNSAKKIHMLANFGPLVTNMKEFFKNFHRESRKSLMLYGNNGLQRIPVLRMRIIFRLFKHLMPYHNIAYTKFGIDRINIAGVEDTFFGKKAQSRY